MVRRSEKHFFQHLNKASPDYGAQQVIRTPEKNENSKFTLEAKFCQILILQFFGSFFFSFLSQEGSDSSLVFCIFSGSLRHKYRVPTRHTLKNFFWPFKGVSAVLKGKIENASSVIF